MGFSRTVVREDVNTIIIKYGFTHLKVRRAIVCHPVIKPEQASCFLFTFEERRGAMRCGTIEVDDRRLVGSRSNVILDEDQVPGKCQNTVGRLRSFVELPDQLRRVVLMIVGVPLRSEIIGVNSIRGGNAVFVELVNLKVKPSLAGEVLAKRRLSDPGRSQDKPDLLTSFPHDSAGRTLHELFFHLFQLI